MSHREYIRMVPDSECAVLMIHGIVGTPRHFDCLIPAVPDNWSVYNILLDGHGGSTQEFCRTSMKKWKTQVDNVLSDLCKRYRKIVVIAHSMGTLLTIDAVPRYPQVQAMILLNVPLHPRVLPALIPRLLKLTFGKVNPDNIWEVSLARAAGVTVTKCLWRYLGFIPRYLELFRLCAQTREKIASITLPCHTYFSVHDELVSMRSRRYFLKHPIVRHHILAQSGHFYYSPEDQAAIESAMAEFLIP